MAGERLGASEPGLAVQLTLTPTPDWTLTLSYMLLTNIHAQVSYRVAPRVRLYGGFDWNNEGYRLADRESVQDRFLYNEQRLVTGVQPIGNSFNSMCSAAMRLIATSPKAEHSAVMTVSILAAVRFGTQCPLPLVI